MYSTIIIIPEGSILLTSLKNPCSDLNEEEGLRAHPGKQYPPPPSPEKKSGSAYGASQAVLPEVPRMANICPLLTEKDTFSSTCWGTASSLHSHGNCSAPKRCRSDIFLGLTMKLTFSARTSTDRRSLKPKSMVCARGLPNWCSPLEVCVMLRASLGR